MKTEFVLQPNSQQKKLVLDTFTWRESFKVQRWVEPLLRYVYVHLEIIGELINRRDRLNPNLHMHTHSFIF